MNESNQVVEFLFAEENNDEASTLEMVKDIICKLEEIKDKTFSALNSDKMASMTLVARPRLAKIVSESRLQVSLAKEEAEVAEAEAGIRYRKEAKGSDGKKPTADEIKNLVTVDPGVREKKSAQYQAEMKYSQLNEWLKTLENAHHLFKSIGKQ